VLYSAVIAGRVTELLDIPKVLQAAASGMAGGEASSAAHPASPEQAMGCSAAGD